MGSLQFTEEGTKEGSGLKNHWVDDLHYVTERKSTVSDTDENVCQPKTTQICISQLNVISQSPTVVILLHISYLNMPEDRFFLSHIGLL